VPIVINGIGIEGSSSDIKFLSTFLYLTKHVDSMTSFTRDSINVMREDCFKELHPHSPPFYLHLLILPPFSCLHFAPLKFYKRRFIQNDNAKKPPFRLDVRGWDVQRGVIIQWSTNDWRVPYYWYLRNTILIYDGWAWNIARASSSLLDAFLNSQACKNFLGSSFNTTLEISPLS